MEYEETHVRSLLKATSWRILAFVGTTVIVYVATGRIRLALTVGAFEAAAKFVGYYIHERVWQKVSFGIPPKDPES